MNDSKANLPAGLYNWLWESLLKRNVYLCMMVLAVMKNLEKMELNDSLLGLEKS